MTFLHTPSRRVLTAGRAAAIVAAALTVLLAGCGDKKKEKAATQTAARVNKEEITVHQINYALAQQRALSPEQAASAGKQVLERLIDQELALQKASEQKIDRDPRVQQQIEFARREIIARAYFDKIGSGAPKPSPDEVHAYYEQHPGLFRERRVYTLQEIALEAPADQLDALRTRLEGSKNIGEFVEYLKSNNIKFTANQAVRAAEQLPLASVPTLAKMKDGQSMFNKTPNGAQIVIVAASRSQPVDEDRARPAIEQFLLNERKRKVIDDDLHALRTSAKVEYVGDYQKTAAEKAAAEKAALEVKPTVSSLTGSAGASAVPIEPVQAPAPSPLIGKAGSAAEPLVPVKPASVPSGVALDKGLKGLK